MTNNKKRNFAAIDIGTNSFHLIIVNVDEKTARFRILDREKEIVRLGSGSTDMKHISESAMTRGVETLKRFRMIADSMNAPIRAIATSAVREALNQQEFIERVKTATSIRVEVAAGVEEARLIYLGVLQALPVFNKQILLVDIGGGSTEFLVGRKREMLFSNSLKLGAVRMTQKFFGGEEPTAKAIKECRKFIVGMMSPITRDLKKYKFESIVGTSGTIYNLANIIRHVRGESDDSFINNFTFTREELFEAVERILQAEDADERKGIPGLDPARADIIVAGALIIEQIFKELNLRSMTISEFALREGIILDTIEKRHANGNQVRHLHDIRRSSIMHLAENMRYEKDHSEKVTALALKLFDQTKNLHKLGATERHYLEAAATLHEIGLFISHSQHHRHSYYLIRNAELLGYTENEKEIIANVARYHRKSNPKLKHDAYRKLAPEDRTIVLKLAGILRIADGLDRTHSSAVKDITCRMYDDHLSVYITRAKRKQVQLELWGAARKKDLFEETFKKEVRLVVK
ncbi:MAG TPA: Ppx/GppA phosphatase family protein [Candidatus Kapabacteria bacterium]|nr:Ppx/GppA phosphatase family protein [Candidatus Kapabacteria bacterium]